MTFKNPYKEDIKCLIENFFKGSLNFSIGPEEISKITWEKQQEFLEATVKSELHKKYPVSNEFIRLMFKKLIDFLEPHQEVHDDFYIYLCSIMKNGYVKDNFCFRHYIINHDLNNVITIKETNNMVINGTTGMRTWEAALMLSDWALCNKEIFANKIVLELGSGVGFTGIAVAKLCKPTSLLLTDCHSDVLITLCENIQINFPNLHREECSKTTLFRDEEKSLEVMMLDWNDVDQSNDFVPDVLIGADIVYDPSILQALCNVFKTFFGKNNSLEIYIASVVRNEETFNSFLLTLDAMDFVYEKLLQPRSVFIEWDNGINRCLLKIINRI